MSCFDNIETEDIQNCANTEQPAGISEVGVHYAIHSQITTFPMPMGAGDDGYNYEAGVTVATDLVFEAGKGFAKMLVQVDTGEVKISIVGNKGNKKTKRTFDFFVPSNNKKLLGFLRTHLNTPMVFCVPERSGQKHLLGDKYNPAYMSEVEGTTGKSGEDDNGIQFTIEAYSIPIIYEGALQLYTPAEPAV